MSTRSLIGIIKENDLVDYVYCHWDGYPSHNGKILLEDYTSEKVLELINKGAMSYLGSTVEGCEFYGNEEAKTDRSINNVGREYAVDYIYLFDQRHNKWLISTSNGFEDLTLEMTNE
jgi:hypothetical protein